MRSKPGDPASRYKEGSQSYPGLPVHRRRQARARQLRRLRQRRARPIEPLKLDLAARYEHFSDFGDTFSSRRPAATTSTTTFAIRGTASTGFRAPTLAGASIRPPTCRPTSAFVQLPPNSAAAGWSASTAWIPRSRRNFSVGFVAHPDSGITATLDLYQIDIDDRIVGSGSLFGSGGANNSRRCGPPSRQRQRPRSHRHPDRDQHLHQRSEHAHPRSRAGGHLFG